jgi:hypothetical protein
MHGKSHSLTLTLPPLGVLFLKREAPVEEPAEEIEPTDEEPPGADDEDEMPFE